jgi:hypothetical protein
MNGWTRGSGPTAENPLMSEGEASSGRLEAVPEVLRFAITMRLLALRGRNALLAVIGGCRRDVCRHRHARARLQPTNSGQCMVFAKAVIELSSDTFVLSR